jgi:hypothetical protein
MHFIIHIFPMDNFCSIFFFLATDGATAGPGLLQPRRTVAAKMRARKRRRRLEARCVVWECQGGVTLPLGARLLCK